MRHAPAIGLTLSAALLATAAVAQQGRSADTDRTEASESTWVDITAWNAGRSYEEGWSANALLDEDAYGSGGEDLGEVEDIIVGPDGRIERVVVEGGGFLDIGDTHAAVPWDEVTRVGTDSVSVPISDDRLGDYTRYPEVDDMEAMGANFRVREIIGDYVSADGVNYGTVDDVVFSEDGRIEAVVVYPSYGYGYSTRPVALPYNAAAYDPRAPYYSVPYGVAQLDELRPIDDGDFGG